MFAAEKKNTKKEIANTIHTMNNIQLFEDKKVRSHYDAEKEIWFFSIVDIVGVLTD